MRGEVSTQELAPGEQTRRLNPYLTLGACFLLVLLVVSGAGELKTRYSWFDILGESLALIAALLWLPLITRWRPSGRVTDALVAGVSCLALGLYLDWLDEFFHLTGLLWDAGESLAMPAGLLLVTLALGWLSDEQRVLNRARRGRESGTRDHLAIDATTDLYEAGYLRDELARRLNNRRELQVHMLSLGLNNPKHGVYGLAQQQRILSASAKLLAASVPDDALVCRYADDCFVVLGSRGSQLDSWSLRISALLTEFLIATGCCAGVERIAPLLVEVSPLAGDTPQALLSRAVRQLKQQVTS